MRWFWPSKAQKSKEVIEALRGPQWIHDHLRTLKPRSELKSKMQIEQDALDAALRKAICMTCGTKDGLHWVGHKIDCRMCVYPVIALDV